jgi:outer membrane receptor protein involved in Fe transport
MIYGSFSRGYKNGGVNGEAIAKVILDGDEVAAEFLQGRTTFDPEVLLNYEFGVKGANPEGTLLLRFAVFYSDRKDVQLKGYVQEAGSDGDAPIFTGYIENGANGKNYGLESDLTYHANERLTFNANIGLLRSEIDGFIAVDGTDMSGRNQAHAPEYQYDIGATYQINERWFASASIEGKDEFYYSMSHDAQSDDYNLLNLTVGYQAENWDVTIWGRNLTDEDYGVRGFYFGNDPRDGYEAKTYTQFGEPARYGATFSYNF